MAKSNSLKLSASKPKRQPIDLDGKEFELRPMADMDARELASIASLGGEYDELEKKGASMTDEEVVQSEDLLNKIVVIYTTIPMDVVSGLPYGVKGQISRAFIVLSGLDKTAKK